MRVGDQIADLWNLDKKKIASFCNMIRDIDTRNKFLRIPKAERIVIEILNEPTKPIFFQEERK